MAASGSTEVVLASITGRWLVVESCGFSWLAVEGREAVGACEEASDDESRSLGDAGRSTQSCSSNVLCATWSAALVRPEG